MWPAIEAVENRPVRRGEVLLRLDDRDLRARVDEAAAGAAQPGGGDRHGPRAS